MLHNLIQKKTTLTDKMKALWEIRDSGKDWDDDQKKSYERMSSEVDKLQKEIAQRSLFLEQTKADRPKAEKRFERETDGIGIQKLLRYLVYKKHPRSDFKEDTGKIEEYTRQAEMDHGSYHKGFGHVVIPPRSFNPRMREYQRVLTTASTSGGPGIQDMVETPTIDLLYANTVFAKIGAKIKEWSGGDYIQPAVSTEAKSETKAEGDALPTVDLTLKTEFTLTPHKMGKLIVASNQWLMQTKDASVIERAMLKEFAEYADQQFLVGDGKTDNIAGILVDSDLATVDADTNGDAITWAKLVNAQTTIENANQSAPLAFITNPNVKGRAKQVLRASASNAKFLWENGMLADLPTAITTLMPNNLTKGTASKVLSNIFITTPSEICIVNFGLPAISLSTEAKDYFEKDQTGYRIVGYADVGLIRPGSSHALIKDLKTTA